MFLLLCHMRHQRAHHCARLDQGLPRRYSATDHTKFNKTGDVKHCPAQAICENCMPLPPNGTETCWAVRTPILYKLTGWHKVQNGSHGGQARALKLSVTVRSEQTPQVHALMCLHGMHHGLSALGAARRARFAVLA